MTRHYSSDSLVQAFSSDKVLTKDQLLEYLGCSPMTLWRMLQSHGYFSSFNFNSRYYTLKEYPVFDSLGIWFHHKIGFSRHGSLFETMIQLVEKGSRGFTAVELKNILTLNVAPNLTRIFQEGKIAREKIAGRFVYFSSRADRKEQQRQAYRVQTASHTLPLPETERIIAVLVELIPQVRLKPSQIVFRLAAKGIPITTKEVRSVFHHFGLFKKNA